MELAISRITDLQWGKPNGVLSQPEMIVSSDVISSVHSSLWLSLCSLYQPCQSHHMKTHNKLSWHCFISSLCSHHTHVKAIILVNVIAICDHLDNIFRINYYSKKLPKHVRTTWVILPYKTANIVKLVVLSTTVTYGNVLLSDISYYDICCFIRVI